jgi:CRISPR/Cas system-associated endonuclease/helicase Cas3
MFSPMPGGGVKMGGRSSGPGGFGKSGDESAMMQSLASSGMLGNSGGGKNNSGAGGPNVGNKGNVPGGKTPKPPKEPREVGTFGEEVKRGIGDVWQEVKEFFSINTWLGIDPETMTPEEEAHAKQVHARYQQLDQEQQAVAKQMYQEKMQKKKMQEEEEKRKKQIEAQKKAQSVQMPSGPKKGAAGGGKSKKGRAMQKLQQDRTTIGTTQGE